VRGILKIMKNALLWLLLYFLGLSLILNYVFIKTKFYRFIATTFFKAPEVTKRIISTNLYVSLAWFLLIIFVAMFIIFPFLVGREYIDHLIVFYIITPLVLCFSPFWICECVQIICILIAPISCIFGENLAKKD
jgi:hypothetical protein